MKRHTRFAIILLAPLGCWPGTDQDPASVRQSCADGQAEACFTLGFWEETGFFGVTQDFVSAAVHYEQACDGGEPRGCSTLAELYRNGSGVPKDPARALNLQHRACDGEEMLGCYSLGEMYQAGEGVPRDTALARAFFEKSCEAGGLGCARVDAPPEPGAERVVRYMRHTSAPFVLNRPEVDAAALAEYPAHLRAAGVTGTVSIHFYVNASGEVEEVRLDQSSGNEELDQAGLRVAEVFNLAPAYYRFYRVPVWATFSVSFPPPY